LKIAWLLTFRPQAGTQIASLDGLVPSATLNVRGLSLPDQTRVIVHRVFVAAARRRSSKSYSPSPGSASKTAMRSMLDRQ
jgi:hypothetical protein